MRLGLGATVAREWALTVGAYQYLGKPIQVVRAIPNVAHKKYL